MLYIQKVYFLVNNSISEIVHFSTIYLVNIENLLNIHTNSLQNCYKYGKISQYSKSTLFDSLILIFHYFLIL